MTSPVLRFALFANAGFSVFCAIPLLLKAQTVSLWLGAGPPWLLVALGIGLVGFAAFLVTEARRQSPRPTYVLIITIADVLWVVGSIALLLMELFSPSGYWVVAGVAGMVLLFAVLQMIGLRQLTRNRRGETAARSFFEIRRLVDAPADIMWERVCDLGRIGDFHPGLTNVEVMGTRSDARRTCTNQRGQQWTEEVTAWDDADRSLTLRFDTADPDFPFPVEEMHGGWHVVDCAGGRQAVVTVWFEYTVAGGWLGEVFAPLVAEQNQGVLDVAIRRMEEEAQQAVFRPASSQA